MSGGEMMGGKRFRILAALGGAAYLLILGFLFIQVRDKAPERHALSLLSASWVAQGEGKPRLIVKGSGFDRHTRVSLAIDAGNRRNILASVPTWGALNDIVVTGSLALTANQIRGLQ